jgi:hypothetical protein
MKERIRPRSDKTEGCFNFYAKIRDAREIELLREASAQMGWASNSAMLHMLVTYYLQATREVPSEL